VTYAWSGAGAGCAGASSDSSDEESESLSLPLSLALPLFPGSFVWMSLAGASSSDCSELESSAACACVTTCFGVAFLGAVFAAAGALDFCVDGALVLGFTLGFAAPFGRCTAMVVLGCGFDVDVAVFSGEESSSSLLINSWLKLALVFVLEPGRGTCVFFVAFIVCAAPCPILKFWSRGRNWELFVDGPVHPCICSQIPRLHG
jgi:hypothetical protein